MGSGGWFRALICLRKAKEDRFNKPKVNATREKWNGSEESFNNHTESASSANVHPQRSNGVSGSSAEHKAAIRIQTAFRAYMITKLDRGRKSVKPVRGVAKSKVSIQSNDTEKQAASALNHIHSWCHIQAQVKARRHRMVTEGRIKQKKLENQLKLEAKLQELEVEWNGSSDTMEEILSRIQHREEAAVKRERAMAYAFSHQWRANPTQYLGQAYYSIGKENWGWSWTERWIAARPWEIRVHSQTNDPKKGHREQVSKTELKLTLSTKPTPSNGKTGIKTRKKSDATFDFQAVDEANAAAVNN